MLLLIGMANACNNITDGNTFLCLGQPCIGDVVSYNGSPCQSGCCHDGICSATACDAKQFEYAIIAIIVASIALTVIFGILYFVLYKNKAGQQSNIKKFEDKRVNENW